VKIRLEMMLQRQAGLRLYLERDYPWPSAPHAGDQVSWNDEWALEEVKWTAFLADGSVHVFLLGMASESDEAGLLAAGWRGSWEPRNPPSPNEGSQ
jgi:hypothetical protein